MRRVISFLASMLLAILLPMSVQALEFGGSLLLDMRAFTDDFKFHYVNREDILEVNLTDEKPDVYRFYASVLGRYFDQSQYSAIDDLAKRTNVSPVSFEIWEARIDLYGLLIKDLDLTLGKQIIAWGKGDGINPTNYLSPFDLSDPIDFTKRLPVWAIRAAYYLPFWEDGEPTLEFIWLPQMTPMVTPPYGADAFGGGGLMIPGMNMKLFQPEFSPDNSILGTRFMAAAAGVDFSVSYQYAFQMVPTLTGIGVPKNLNLAATGGGFSATSISDVALGFPRVHVIGADLATEFFGIGMWGEVAVLLPQVGEAPNGDYFPVTILLPYMDKVNGMVPEQIVDPKPYVQWVAGMDYTFPRALYVNAQFARGMFFEASPNMSDYIMFSSRFFPMREIRLEGSAGFVLDNIKTYTKDTMGYFGRLGIAYRGITNVELGLEQFMFAGGKNSLFGSFSNFDQLKFVGKVKF